MVRSPTVCYKARQMGSRVGPGSVSRHRLFENGIVVAYRPSASPQGHRHVYASNRWSVEEKSLNKCNGQPPLAWLDVSLGRRMLLIMSREKHSATEWTAALLVIENATSGVVLGRDTSRFELIVRRL